ncbi:GNAT family N-acetyltransferase [Marinobacter salinisoli]|uniref:GNAT family N-acetyltransferase n=1 Tax=Marinobacter salinisoli TaxID=2769486 RepID=A0ABX7MTX5_9GAMM|nr:GNAT family N-acetyltransferase [Marinobacter salinisoli]QSP93693.1 GNAT family N-acetyltransferase [Marinobacter salinisoli]
MKLIVVRSATEFECIREQWDSFVGKVNPVPLPMTFAWLWSWWKAFSLEGGMEMEFRCVYQGPELVGVAPLVRLKHRYRGVTVTLLKLAANGHSPYSSVIVDTALSPAARNRAFSLLTQVGAGEIGLFLKVEQDSELQHFLLDDPGRGKAHKRVGQKPSLRTPVVNINQSWEDFYRSRPRSLKKSLNHKMNRFRKYGGFTIHEEKIRSTDQPIVEDLITVSARSWKSTVGNDLKSNTRSRQFLVNLIKVLGPSESLSAWVIRDKERPVAFELHLIFDNVVYPIRADYDSEYKAYSPGSVLECSALKHLFEQGRYQQYYTCADDYWYLSNWTTEYKDFCSIELFGDSLKLKALYFLEYRIIPMLKRVFRPHGSERRPKVRAA